MNMTPDLCRAARNLLRITRTDFAGEVGIAEITLKKYEDGLRATDATGAKIEAAFSKHGVTFKNGRTVQSITRRAAAKHKGE